MKNAIHHRAQRRLTITGASETIDGVSRVTGAEEDNVAAQVCTFAYLDKSWCIGNFLQEEPNHVQCFLVLTLFWIIFNRVFRSLVPINYTLRCNAIRRHLEKGPRSL